MDKEKLKGKVESGDVLMGQAIDAMRRYHEARDYGAPKVEVDQLRLLAESLFQAASEYQQRVVADAMGKEVPKLH